MAALQATRLKFKELSLHIDANFWHELERRKLNDWRLDEPAVAVSLFQPSLAHRAALGSKGSAAVSGTVSLLPESFKTDFRLPNHGVVAGVLKNYNTIQQLVDLDKKAALIQAGNTIVLHDILADSAQWNQSASASSFNPTAFVMFSFADLKTHEFHYCAAFPAIDLESPVTVTERKKATDALPKDVQESVWAHALSAAKNTQTSTAANPFVIIDGNILPFNKDNVKGDTVVIAFTDSSYAESPCWSLRNILAAVRLSHPSKTRISLLALRESIDASILFDCTFEPLDLEWLAEKKRNSSFKVVGWVDTVIHKVEMGSVMDPVRLAESSAKLNLGLMKWRMLPELSLDGLQQCKALLLGSGTLGCNIGRQLLMWGVTHITFVDRGNVSYSNPVRQTLFELNDVLAEGEKRFKCVAAANAVKRILPSATTRGVNMTIRMPGHRVDPDQTDAAKKDIQQLEDLIKEHDVIFLLTDSRESRWLPTVLASLNNKPIINTALGFDSYVVMRHGVANQIGSGRLGCYFCNDVVAPQDSLTARSLDQQCTVTRPGVSAIASAMAVELLASLYNHPASFRAPAYREDDDEREGGIETKGETCLGIVPHQLRGNVHGYHLHTLHGTQYNKCTACSDCILEHVRSEGYDFLIKCLNNPMLMEEVTGLKAEKDAVAKAYENWDDDEAFDD